MTDPNDTLPPRKPNTLRVWLPRAWAFCRAHWDYAGPVIGLLIGFLLGKV